MYIVGLIIPVPAGRRGDYEHWAQKSAALLRDIGCREIVEAWEEDVPDGKTTDFRRAVALQPGEKIVFSWQIWPDRQTLDAAEKIMQTDPRFEPGDDVPFDAHRMIYGGFLPLHVAGRGQG